MNIFNGYTESQSQTDARAWKLACGWQGYTYRHNVTEAEADEVHDLIRHAEILDEPAPIQPAEMSAADDGTWKTGGEPVFGSPEWFDSIPEIPF